MLHSLDFFVAFYSISDNNNFEKIKKSIEKIPTPKSLQEIPHYEGKAQVGMNNEKQTLGRNLIIFSNTAQAAIEKVMKANEDTVRVMQILVNAFERQSEAYKELTALYTSIEVIFIYKIV